MDQHFFRVPFAANGDKETVPEAANNEGFVSFTQGYGVDYAKDPGADAHAKPVERESMNFVLNAITGAVRQYQTHGYPEWITPADNIGTAFGYDAGVVVLYNGILYLSLVAANFATPGTDISKWQPYIQREATEEEALEGTGSIQNMTPRRVKAIASHLDEQIVTEIKKQITPVTVPIGGIMLWGTATPPDGWMECNGQAFNITDNPKLYAIYPGGSVPDFRGRFIRGWANGSPTDPDSGRGILSIQGQQTQRHNHSAPLEKSSDGIPGPESIIGLMWSGSPRKVTTNAGTSYVGGDETRPGNIAVMYIIKTDQAEAQEGEAGPGNIIVTPASANIQAGYTQQFTANVLPSSVADNYPVSWAVSDSTLGGISSSGLYTATAGVSGVQTIIASISTGLAVTVTVAQSIWLTNISIGAMPAELLSGENYDIAITYNPVGFTEAVIAASSDTSVATLTSNGTLSVLSAGTATLSLTGAQSGVTASVVVMTKEGAGDEVYLQIANNLSEIADAGEEAQAEAQGNLGLGELATKDSLNAFDVGAVPLSVVSLPADLDLNELTTPGEYFQNVSSYATTENNYPVQVAGAVKVVATGVDEGACRQFYWPYNSTKEYRRCGYGEPLVFGEWAEY